MALRPARRLSRRHLHFLIPVNEQRGAAIELVRDIEQMLGEVVRRHARQQHAADAQMDIGTVLLGNQRISRLLDPVVQEFVGALLGERRARADGLPEGSVHRRLWFPVNQGQGGDFRDIAQAGELFQGFLGGAREPLQLARHEIHHVIGVALGADAIDVPLPGLA